MDFINQARKLADTLKDKVQETATNTANGIEEVVDGIKNTTVEITESSINAVINLPATAQQGFQSVQNVGKVIEGTAIGVTTSSVARHAQAGGFGEEAADAYKNTFDGSAPA